MRPTETKASEATGRACERCGLPLNEADEHMTCPAPPKPTVDPPRPRRPSARRLRLIAAAPELATELADNLVALRAAYLVAKNNLSNTDRYVAMALVQEAIESHGRLLARIGGGAVMSATEVNESEWLAAVGEARLRVRFDRDSRVRAARKEYKQAQVRGVSQHDAWVAANAVYKTVNAELRAKLAVCSDPETF